MGLLSHQQVSLVKVSELQSGDGDADNRREVKSRAVFQQQRRLTPDEHAELVARYQAGERAFELAKAFGVNRRTIPALLERAGVPRRPRGLLAEQVAEAIELYEQGWSLARIGEHFAKNAGTIHIALRKAGVALRDGRGR